MIDIYIYTYICHMSYIHNYIYIFIFKYAVQYIFFSYTHIYVYINTYLYIHRHMIYIHACIYTSGKGPFVSPFPRFSRKGASRVARSGARLTEKLHRGAVAFPRGVSVGMGGPGWEGLCIFSGKNMRETQKWQLKLVLGNSKLFCLDNYFLR